MPTSSNLYISSCCSYVLLREILGGAFLRFGCGIELGAFRSADAAAVRSLAAMARERGIPLLAHNYFYPPEIPFVLNLSDPDADNRARSLEYVYAMIEFCAEFNIPAFSVHSGFACSMTIHHFSKPISMLPACELAHAYELFAASLEKALARARDNGVALLVENNVLTADNLSDGKNLHLLLSNGREIVSFFERFGLESGLGLLLDLGHLKVSASSLELPFEEEVALVAPFVRQVHIHDNNGVVDQHLPLDDASGLWNVFAYLGAASWILEQPGLNRESALRQLAMLLERKRYA